ncbi:uncharacterized protein BJ212DRAFT_1332337 [Suillus subaureus]|uniref:Uncharacterized protein n=1 Tax=Suillus subaureus TaxID=48587 RepID=A0A9P7EHY6_9AGAM|nr:uncharacterized protein BJ212DRAFT_1332337 [Suillus subaureus]KAG1821597.1 hypothetical protein BJ212DRAFT_1332337 [Suillus subaureus]
MLVAAPFERSSEVVVCDALLVNPGVTSLMRMIKMMEPIAAIALCVAAFPMAALRRSWPIMKEITSKLGYCLRTGTARLAEILVACFSKIAHMSSSVARYIAMFMITAYRWLLFIIHRVHALLAACLCWISMGIKAIHHVVQRKPATKAQIPIITITPAENPETSACESVMIAALLEEISDGATGVKPLLGDASPNSEDCPTDDVIVESQIDKPLLHASRGQVGGEELLVVEQHVLLDGQDVHTKCLDHEIRPDAPGDTLPGAMTGKPEIHAICSRDSGGPVVVKIEGPVAYSPLVPSGDDEATATASIPCKAGYPITRLAPKERAPGEQPTYSEGVYQKTIPGSAELGAKKQESSYNNQDVLNPCVVIDVPESKGPSHCLGTTTSTDESPSDPAVESIKPYRAVQPPLPACSLTPSRSTASELSLIVQGENGKRLNASTVSRQKNSDQCEDNSPNKICFSLGNETFMPEAIMETKESAIIPSVPPSSAPRKTNSSLFMTIPEASTPGEFPSAQLSAHNAQLLTSPNTKECPSSIKEGPTKIASDDKLYSTSNSNPEGREPTSEIWDFPKSGTNAPFHRFLSASIHAPSGQSPEPAVHCTGGAIEASPAMPQSGRPPHVVLSKNSLNHRAASFTPHGLVLKSTSTTYDPPLRLVGPGLEQGDHALSLNRPNHTHSRKYMADLPDHTAKVYGLQPLHSAGTYATHRNVPPQMAVSGSNHVTTYRAPSTRGLVPDWAAEAAAERRSVDMHISAPKVYLGTPAARASSLHQPSGTTTIRMPIPEDIFSPAPQRVASKVARWAAEVNRVREPAMSQILEGSSLDAQVKGCCQGGQQRPLLLNRKANTTLSRDDTPAVFPSASGTAYHDQGPVFSEFAKRAVETCDKEQTKYGDFLSKMFDKVLMRILGLSPGGSTTLTTNPSVQGTWRILY